MRYFLPLILTLLTSGCFNAETPVTISKEGQGTVTGESINCGADCETTYVTPISSIQKKIFDTRTIVAEADPGYEFHGWTGSNRSYYPFFSGCKTNTECTLFLETECSDTFADPRPWSPCLKVDTGKIEMTAIFTPTDSVVSSDWARSDGGSSCLIDTNNQLRCWGKNIGNNVPVVNNPTSVEVGHYSACVLDDSGLQCWGQPDITGNNIPSFTNLEAFDVADHVACAIDQNKVRCWGDYANDYLPAPEMTDPINIRMYDRTAACVDDMGETLCWGPKIKGLGKVPTLSNPIDISANQEANCVLESNRVKCWRDGTLSQLDIPELINATEIASNYTNIRGGYYVCVRDNGILRCWRPDGDVPNKMVERLNVPLEVQSMAQIEMDGAYNSRDVCGLVDNAVKCWEGGTTVTTLPLSNPIALDVNYWNVCAISNTTLVCDDQLNRNFRKSISIQNPSVVASNNSVACVGGESGLQCFVDYHDELWAYTDPTVNAPKDLTNVTALAIGEHNGCAIHDAKVTCWGSDALGVLDVPPLTNPTKIEVGIHHACALDDTGVVCWGETIPK